MVVTSPQHWSHHTSTSSEIGHKSALGVASGPRPGGRGRRMRRRGKSLREIIGGVCTQVAKPGNHQRTQVTKSVAVLNGGLPWSTLTAMTHCLAREGFKWMQRWQNNRSQNYRARRGQTVEMFCSTNWCEKIEANVGTTKKDIKSMESWLSAIKLGWVWNIRRLHGGGGGFYSDC